MTRPTSDSDEISLARGGFFHALLRKVGLVRDDGHDLRRQIVAAIAIGWVPLLLFAGVETLRGHGPDQLVLQTSVHTRSLLAVPLWLVTERVLDESCARTLRRFPAERLADSAAVERITRYANRWRVSWWPEMVLLAAAMVLGQLTLWSIVGESGLLERGRRDAAQHLSLLRVWYASVSLPLFNFLFARTLWRWFIWVRALKQLSSLPLRMVPTHPDRAGGIAFVSAPCAALAPAVVAASSVLAGAWGDQILTGASKFHEFKLPLATFLVLAESIVVGPALLFTGPMFRTRLQGLRQYGSFALLYTRRFHERWIDPGKTTNESAEGLLETPEIQTLADLAVSHSLVEQMKPAPIGMRVILLVALGVLLPMLPLAATEKSLSEIFMTIGRPLLGGLPR